MEKLYVQGKRQTSGSSQAFESYIIERRIMRRSRLRSEKFSIFFWEQVQQSGNIISNEINRGEFFL